jgi:hypothetical protein
MPIRRHLAPLFALAVLTGCSDIYLAMDDVPRSVENPDYRQLVATAFKTTFRDYASYDAFEISAPRMVHSMSGWNWMTCVRFAIQRRRRTYVFLIKNNQIVIGRYNVQTDECEAQTYAPFGAEMDMNRPGNPALLSPLY